jgi:hypothetical protein
MLETTETMSLTSLLVIVGPILLGMALIYGAVMYRKRSRALKQYTDVSTKRLYKDAAERERRAEGADPGPTAR